MAVSTAHMCKPARRQPRLAALLLAAAAVAVAPSALAQIRMPFQGAAKKPVEMKPPGFTPAKRTPLVTRANEFDSSSWFESMFGAMKAEEPGAQTQQLDLQAAGKLLVAMGSVVGGAMLADGAGLIYAADVLDVMDAQALLSEGLADGAEVNMDENLVNLQLALQDGTQKVITLFTK